MSNDTIPIEEHKAEVLRLKQQLEWEQAKGRRYRSALDLADVVARLAQGKDAILDDRIQMYQEYRQRV
jgi:guanylate kinase